MRYCLRLIDLECMYVGVLVFCHETMTSTLVGILGQWVRVYNDRAAYCIARLLGAVTLQKKTKSVLLVTPTGSILQSVVVCETTTVADIAPWCWVYLDTVTLMKSTSVLWSYVEDGGQLTVLPHNFQAQLDTRLPTQQTSIVSLSWNASGTRLASGTSECKIIIWNFETPSPTPTILKYTELTNALDWHPTGQWLASAGGHHSGQICIWNMRSCTCTMRIRDTNQNIYSIKWHPSGNYIASGLDHHTVMIWAITLGQNGLTTWKRHHVLRHHVGLVTSIQWNPNGTTLATAGRDKTTRIWDMTGKCLQLIKHPHLGWVYDSSWHPNGLYLVNTFRNGTVQMWDISAKSKVPMRTIYLEATMVTVEWHFSGKWLACGHHNGTIEIWNETLEQQLHTLKEHTSAVNALAWRPHSTQLTSGSPDATICIYK